MAGGVLADGVDAEADLVADVRLQDLNGSLGVVAVDKQIWADELVVRYPQAVSGTVHHDCDFQAGESG